MTAARAFIGVGSNVLDSGVRIAEALRRIDGDVARVAAVGRTVSSPYEVRKRERSGPAVLNTVAEVRTSLEPRALLQRLQQIEDEGGRTREEPWLRTIDLDLLAYEDRVVDEPGLTLPHPRCTRRAFVLGPWEGVAPTFRIAGSPHTGPARTVVEHAAQLRASDVGAFRALEVVEHRLGPFREGEGALIEGADQLRRWRRSVQGSAGAVMTMGALHAGHASLVQRAVAECEQVVATLFVNPLQFGPDEDLERYPRTLDADLALLRECGVSAVYVPDPSSIYGPGFATTVDPHGAAEGFEGAWRPAHFRGVATIVLKLWNRLRPDRAYFGRKDAQQVAVIQQLVRDLDLDGEVVVCPTVRELDGLALSSRNRYLDVADRRRALFLGRALEGMAQAAAEGERATTEILAAARTALEEHVDAVDYLAVVEADTMRSVETLGQPALAIAAVRVGGVRLLDNRWIAQPAPVEVEA